MTNTIRFGAVLVPSNAFNRTLRETTHEKGVDEFGYPGFLKELAGDPTAGGDRGEWRTGVREVGELLISSGRVPDDLMKSRIEAAGFQNVRIIPNHLIGDHKKG